VRTLHHLSLGTLAVLVIGGSSVGCLALAGIADFQVVDEEGGADGGAADTLAPPTPTGDGATDASLPETSAPDAEVDATVDAEDAAPPPSPGLSGVQIPGTGVLVGKATTVVLTCRNETGDAVPRIGARVVLTTTGGTSVVSFGPVTDLGDGRYRATVTGVTAGTKIDLSATLDGAPLKTPPASLRVVAPITAGLTFHVDASNADGAGSFGGKGCPGAGRASLTDLSPNATVGTLAGFVSPCGAGSGWAGTGTPLDPERLTFDGQDDHVSFGAVNALTKYTVVAWIRKTGAGTLASTGTGGLSAVFPILSKGSAEAENGPVDINYLLAIDESSHFATDYEQVTTSTNTPLTGTALVRDDEWAMVATTLDAATGVRANWVNGVSDVTLAPVAAPGPANLSLLVLGGTNRTNGVAQGRFKGDVAAVLTYDRVLSAQELVSLCHGYSTRFGFGACPP